MILKFTVLFLTVLALIATAKVHIINELNEATFSQKTYITIDQQHGSIISHTNSMIYFFIQGQQQQQHYQNTRKQFESTALSYLKSKHQKIIISQKLDQVLQDEYPKPQSEITSPQNLEIKEQINQKDPYQINFYIIKCPKNQENSNKKVDICTNLGIYETQQQSKVFFFTSNSQILKYKQQITENKLFLFISKVQENSNFFKSALNMDEELYKVAQKFELKNISLTNKALGLLERIKSYLSWDLLKFLVIFGVLPFLFGYLSSKSQQKANKQRMEKYGLNLQESNKNKSKELKEEKNQ